MYIWWGSCDVSSGGDWLLVCDASASLHVWNMESVVSLQSHPARERQEAIYGCAFGGQGAAVASGQDGSLWFYRCISFHTTLQDAPVFIREAD